jgi:general stress protein YciG
LLWTIRILETYSNYNRATISKSQTNKQQITTANVDDDDVKKDAVIVNKSAIIKKEDAPKARGFLQHCPKKVRKKIARMGGMSYHKRRQGLGALSAERRKIIARQGGQHMAAIHRNDNYYSRNGRRGGKTVLQKHGKNFYARIGRLGGIARRLKKKQQQ